MPILAFYCEVNVPLAPWVVGGFFQEPATVVSTYGARLIGYDIAIAGDHTAIAHFSVRQMVDKGYTVGRAGAGIGVPLAAVQPIAPYDDPLDQLHQIRTGRWVADSEGVSASVTDAFLADSYVPVTATRNPANTEATWGNRVRAGHVKHGTTTSWRSRQGILLRKATCCGFGIVLTKIATGPAPVSPKAMTTMFVKVPG